VTTDSANNRYYAGNWTNGPVVQNTSLIFHSKLNIYSLNYYGAYYTQSPAVYEHFIFTLPKPALPTLFLEYEEGTGVLDGSYGQFNITTCS